MTDAELARAIAEKAAEQGGTVYFVGGCVRDRLLGLENKDIDIEVHGIPAEALEQLLSELGACMKIGKSFGIYGLKGHALDIALPRTERRTGVGHRDFAVTSDPFLGTYEAAKRRDFTMNALAYHPAAGVVDLVGGRADIEAGLVRCVGDPDRRFREDGLRMLRALRFASVYGMTIEPGTAAAVHRNRALLERIAAERVQAELTKLLCGRGAAAVLRSFADVLAVLIPELAPMFGFDQRNPHHDRDVWEHTIAVVEHTPPEPVLRWAALLHDIGKPSCFSRTEDGVGHFFGHAEQSTVMAEQILNRLRFDRDGRERIVRLVRFHDMPLTADRRLVKRLLSKHGEEAARQLIELHRADTWGQSAVCKPRLAVFDAMDAMAGELLREAACFSLKDLAVNGTDMLDLGFRGREIGAVLQKCLDAVLDERAANDRDELLSFAQAERTAAK